MNDPFAFGPDGSGGFVIGGFWVTAWLLIGLALAARDWHTRGETLFADLSASIANGRAQATPGWWAKVALAVALLVVMAAVRVVGWPFELARRAATRLWSRR